MPTMPRPPLENEEQWMTRYSRQILLPEVGGTGQRRINETMVTVWGNLEVAEALMRYGNGVGIEHWRVVPAQGEQPSWLQRLMADYPRHCIEWLPDGLNEEDRGTKNRSSWTVIMGRSSNLKKWLVQSTEWGLVSLLDWGDYVGRIHSSVCRNCLPEPLHREQAEWAIPPYEDNGSKLTSLLVGTLSQTLLDLFIMTVLQPDNPRHRSRLIELDVLTSEFSTQSLRPCSCQSITI